MATWHSHTARSTTHPTPILAWWVIGSLLLSSVSGPWTAGAWAMPAGAEVEQGTMAVETGADGALQITASDQTVIRWQAFDIAQGERVRFLQPSSAASVLNRIVGGSASQIAGTLTANGLIILLNPAGFLFAPSAVVNVGGLIASSLDLSTQDFLNRRYRFSQPEGVLSGAIVNHGTLQTTGDGGVIALLGGAVANAGSIVARLGTVALAAGAQATVSFEPDGRIAVAVDAPTSAVVLGPDGRVADAAVNTGTLSAPGGTVWVTASAARQIFDHAVNQAGVIEAGSVAERGGRIFLTGDGAPVVLAAGSRTAATGGDGTGPGGTVQIQAPHDRTDFQPGAVVDVSGGAAGGDAGFAEISGQLLRFGGRVIGTAADGFQGGRLLIDPLNLILDTSTQGAPTNNASPTPDVAFGDAPTGGTTTIQISDITGFAEARFEATQDITVNNTLTMDSGRDLVLRAGRDILLNANVQVQGSSGHMTLTADADFSSSGGAASDGVGTIVQAAGTSILAGAGDVVLQTGSDFTIRTITGASGGTIAITSSHGSILDDGDAATKLTGATVTLTANAAGQGVGTTGALNTDLTTLNLTVGAGGASIRDAGAFTLNAPTVASGGSLDLRANDNLTIASSAAVAVTGAGTVTLAADADGSGAGDLVMNSGSSITSAGGAIALSAGDTMTVRTINAGSGPVSITTSTGSTSISDDGNNATKITAGTLTLSATGAIGAGGASGQLDTSVDQLTVATTNGSIFLGNDKALQVASATTSGTGDDITITTSAGDLTLGTLTAADDLTLTSAGAMTMLNGGSLVSGDRLTASAATGMTLATSMTDIDLTNSTSGNITVVEATGLDIRAATTSAGNGAIIVTTTAGALTTSGAISAHGSGVVTLTAGGAASGLTVGDAITSTSGAIALTAPNGVTLSGSGADVTTTGSYTVDADSDASGAGTYTQSTSGTAVASGTTLITAADIALTGTINSGAADVTLRPSTAAATIGVGDTTKTFNVSNAEIGKVTTTGTLAIGSAANTGGVTVGTSEAINAGSTALELLTKGVLAIHATRGITTTGTLTLSADGMALAGGPLSGANVTLRPVTASTAIGVEDNTKTLSLTDAELDTTSTSGTLTVGALTNTGGITVGTDAALTQGAKALAFVTGGDVAIGANGVTTTGNVTLTADADSTGTGAISTGAGVVAANLLTVSAAQGLALNTSVASLSATNTTSGTLAVTEADSLTITGLSAAGGGAVTLTATDLAITGPISAGSSDVTLRPVAAGTTIGLGTGPGTFTLTDAELDQITTTGTLTLGRSTAGALTVDGLTQGAKNLTVVSGGTINDTDDTGSAITTTGTLTLTSGGAIGNLNGAQGLNTDIGTLTVTSTGGNAVTLRNAGTADLTVNQIATGGAGDVAVTQAANNLALGTVTTTGSATLAATTGALTDANGSATNVTAGTLTATAATGLDLDTAVNTVTAGVTGTGTLDLSETDALTVTSATTADGALTILAGGPLTVTSATAAGAGSDITLTASVGDLALGTVTAADDVTLTAAGAIEELGTDSAADLVGDAAILTAATGIGAAGTLETTLASLAATITGSGALDLTDTDALTVTSATTSAGTLTITTGGDMAVGALTASGDTVTLTSAGALTDANGSATNVTAGTLTATAATGLDLDTAVNTVTAGVTGTGTLDLSETDALTVTSATTADGALTIASGGTMTVGTVSGSSVALTASGGGSILSDGSGSPTVTASTGATLTAGGTIGTSAVPVTVSIGNGSLTVIASGVADGVSANLRGTVNPSNNLDVPLATLGLVLFNAAQRYPIPSVIQTHYAVLSTTLTEFVKLLDRPSSPRRL